MTHPPFGLSPQVFSIVMVAGWLILGPLVAGLFMRNKRKRLLNAGSPSQQAEPLAPVYPSLTPPEQPYADLLGLWHYKSAARWIGVICGVVVGIGVIQLPLLTAAPLGATCLLVIVLSLWRPTLAAQQCNIDRNLAVTLGRGGREIPLDLNHYRYVRMHVSSPRYGQNFPSMVVFNRDSRPGFGALLGSMLFPRVDDGRIVMFYSRWSNADGAVMPPNRLDDFFLDACRRSGYEPYFRRTWFTTGRAGWEVRPY